MKPLLPMVLMVTTTTPPSSSPDAAVPAWVMRGGHAVTIVGNDAPADGPVILFLHATGFNGATYRGFLSALLCQADGVAAAHAPSMRGHGATTLPLLDKLTSWHPYAQDVEAYVQSELRGRELILMGHSMGAVTAAFLARRLGPDHVRGVVMIDPVLTPTIGRALLFTPLRRLLSGNHPLVKRTRARRAHWPSRVEARSSLLANRFFANWDEAAFDGYIAEGIVSDEAGEARLACDPAWEASTFMAQAHQVMPAIGGVIGRGIPVHVCRATGGRSTVPAPFVPRLKAIGAAVHAVEGPHLLPQEAGANTLEALSGVFGALKGR